MNSGERTSERKGDQTTTDPLWRRGSFWGRMERSRLAHTRSSAFLWTHQVNHRAGAGLTLILRGTTITPNMISVLSVLMYAPVAAYIGLTTPPISPFGALAVFLWLQVAYTLDCTDGQLARVRGQSSEFGGWLDRVFDFSGHAALLVAVAVFLTKALALAPTTAVLLTGLVLGVHLTQMFASFYRTAIMGSTPAVSTPSLPLRLAFSVMQVTDYGLFLFAISLGLIVPRLLVVILLAYTAVLMLMLLGQIVINWRRQCPQGRGDVDRNHS